MLADSISRMKEYGFHQVKDLPSVSGAKCRASSTNVSQIVLLASCRNEIKQQTVNSVFEKLVSTAVHLYLFIWSWRVLSIMERMYQDVSARQDISDSSLKIWREIASRTEANAGETDFRERETKHETWQKSWIHIRFPRCSLFLEPSLCAEQLLGSLCPRCPQGLQVLRSPGPSGQGPLCSLRPTAVLPYMRLRITEAETGNPVGFGPQMVWKSGARDEAVKFRFWGPQAGMEAVRRWLGPVTLGGGPGPDCSHV